MSIKYVAYGWDIKLRPALREVYMAMADHADHNGRNIFPSLGLLAWKMDVDVRTVRRLIRELETTGIVVLDKKGNGRATNSWHIDISKAIFKEPFQNETGQIVRSDRIELCPVRPDRAMSAKPSIEPSIEPCVTNVTLAVMSTPDQISTKNESPFPKRDIAPFVPRCIDPVDSHAKHDNPFKPTVQPGLPPAPPVPIPESRQVFSDLLKEEQAKLPKVKRERKPKEPKAPKPPKEPRPRNAVFDAIAAGSFNIAIGSSNTKGSYIGKIVAVVKDCTAPEHQDTLAQDLTAMYAWYGKAQQGPAVPTIGEKICKYLAEWRVQHKPPKPVVQRILEEPDDYIAPNRAL